MYSASVVSRFWAKVQKGPDCWNWKGAKSSAGYGELAINSYPRLAHRIAWELAHGPIPVGMEICHKCDNRKCVNPSHLFLGTHRDNMMDMKEKGRGFYRGENVMTAHPEKRHWGERNGQSKLTTEQVKQIRARYASGNTTTAKLGAEYGVTRHMIGDIVNRRKWAWLEDK